MPKIRIPNCKVQKATYGVDADIQTLYQSCTECGYGFYLKANINKINICVPRMNVDTNCGSFKTNDDLCLSCKTNHYLTTD